MTATLTWAAGADGLVCEAQLQASPNCDPRPRGERIDLVVLHFISVPAGRFGGPGILDLFGNRLDPLLYPELARLRVSAHFLIRRDGRLIQFVPCAMRAWHAGASRWNGRERCNDFSIGIELEGCPDRSFEEAQYLKLSALLTLLRSRYPIRDVVGHEHVAPGRKDDPGPCFDWPRIGGILFADGV